jgi:DNA polymerase-4
MRKAVQNPLNINNESQKTRNRPVRTILHVDMDAFYAAVEQQDYPEFKGRPVVIGADPKHGRGRGVVSTASYEARPFGIHSAQPISQAWRCCPHAIYLPVRMSRYVTVSRQIMEILSGFSPYLEKISLDEAFLDLSGSERLLGNPKSVGRQIKQHIVGETGLTASIGIGPNKLIAKIASDFRKPDGLTCVTPDRVQDFLNPLPIRRLWGIGRQTELRLKSYGVQTIEDLTRFDLDFLMREFGKWGRCLYYYVRGIDESPVAPYRDVKSLSNEITFKQDERDREIFRKTLLHLCDKVGHRLREKQVMARTISIKVRFSDFTTLIRNSTLPQPVHLSETIYQEIYHLFESIDTAERSIRLLGVGVSQLISADALQGDLFLGEEKRSQVNAAVDQIKNKFGDRIIRRGV